MVVEALEVQTLEFWIFAAWIVILEPIFEMDELLLSVARLDIHLQRDILFG